MGWRRKRNGQMDGRDPAPPKPHHAPTPVAAAAQARQMQDGLPRQPSAPFDRAYRQFLHDQEHRDVQALMSMRLGSDRIDAILDATGSDYARGVIAGHPNTRPETLSRLAEQYADRADVRVNLAGNRHSDGNTLERVRLFAQEAGDVTALRAVASHPNSHPATVGHLSRSPHPSVRVHALWNPNCPADAVNARRGDGDPEVRFSVADSPHATLGTLTLLADPATEPDAWVRDTARHRLGRLPGPGGHPTR